MKKDTDKSADKPGRREKKQGLLPSLSILFYKNFILTAFLLVILIVSSWLVYSNHIKREGFPGIQFPVVNISGAYFVNDLQRVDDEITQPLNQALVDFEGVSEVSSTSTANASNLTVFFDSDIDPYEQTQLIQDMIESKPDLLPEGVELNYLVIDPVRYFFKHTILLSLYNKTDDVPMEDLQKLAEDITIYLNRDDQIVDAVPEFMLETSRNPVTNQLETRQVAFNNLGLAGDEDQTVKFYSAITIGLSRKDDSDLDLVDFSEHVQDKISKLSFSQYGEGYELVIMADFAEDIKSQISSLESNLLTALVAVVIVSFFLISWRVSIITSIFITSVVLITIMIMYLFGLTLNVITLFALVLSLGLFVDDATIISEVIDANKHKSKSNLQIIRESLSRIVVASFLGTITTVLVFVPILFTGGIIGDFIRSMPITIIIALLTSFFLSIILVPFLSRFLILKGKPNGFLVRINPIIKLEKIISRFLANRILNIRKKGFSTKIFPILAVLISLVMIGSIVSLAKRVGFDIFSAPKDGNNISVVANFPEGYSLDQAEDTIDIVNQAISDSLGSNAKKVYYPFINPDDRQANLYIDLIHYDQREVTSPQLADRLRADISQRLDRTGVEFDVATQSEGPTAETFPFQVQVFEDDPQKAFQLVNEINDYIEGAELKRTFFETDFKITDTKLPPGDSITRLNGQQVYVLSARFDATDTSTLVQETTMYVQEKFSEDYLLSNGYAKDALNFGGNQEEENSESFQSLGLVFPIVLVLMIILLSVYFRSILKSFLILLAPAFALPGIFLGLYLTDNTVGFFSMLGLISLLGIAVNNTILLTSYTNQELRAGKPILEAVAEATEKRFRPIITTSLTTIVALLPLALTDPFWEALSFTIIFGLLTSTFLVVLSFPYYYIVVEKTGRVVSRIVRDIFAGRDDRT